MTCCQLRCAGKQGPDIGFEHAAGTLADDQPKCFHEPADLIGQLDHDLDHPVAGSDQCSGQHAVILLDPNLTVKTDFRKLRQAVGIVRIGLVRRHVEGCFGMSSINTDRWHAFGRQRMIEPDRQRAGLEDDALGVLAHARGSLRPAPWDRMAHLPRQIRLPFLPHRDRRLFQRHIQSDILVHGCSPLMLGPGFTS